MIIIRGSLTSTLLYLTLQISPLLQYNIWGLLAYCVKSNLNLSSGYLPSVVDVKQNLVVTDCNSYTNSAIKMTFYILVLSRK